MKRDKANHYTYDGRTDRQGYSIFILKDEQTERQGHSIYLRWTKTQKGNKYTYDGRTDR